MSGLPHLDPSWSAYPPSSGETNERRLSKPHLYSRRDLNDPGPESSSGPPGGWQGQLHALSYDRKGTNSTSSTSVPDIRGGKVTVVNSMPPPLPAEPPGGLSNHSSFSSQNPDLARQSWTANSAVSSRVRRSRGPGAGCSGPTTSRSGPSCGAKRKAGESAPDQRSATNPFTPCLAGDEVSNNYTYSPSTEQFAWESELNYALLYPTDPPSDVQDWSQLARLGQTGPPPPIWGLPVKQRADAERRCIEQLYQRIDRLDKYQEETSRLSKEKTDSLRDGT